MHKEKFLDAVGLIIALVGMITGLGGLGVWLGRDYPFIVNNAGIIGLVGLALVACGGGIVNSVAATRTRAAKQ